MPRFPPRSARGWDFVHKAAYSGTTGNLTEVILTMLVNGTLRTGSYTTPLLP